MINFNAATTAAVAVAIAVAVAVAIAVAANATTASYRDAAALNMIFNNTYTDQT